MTQFFLPGEFFRNTRGVIFSDAGGISWTFDAATNTLIASGTGGGGGLDADTLDGMDSTAFVFESNFEERVEDFAAALIQNGTGISWSYNDAGATLTPTVTLAPFSTTNLSEGSNQYFTNARVYAATAAAPVPLKGYTVATLPAAPAQGVIAFVTDALAPAYLTPVAGSGAIVTPVFFDGTNWVTI